MKKRAQRTRRVLPANSANGPAGEGRTEEAIRRRAFEIYLARTDGSGDELSDWLQAEQELSEL